MLGKAEYPCALSFDRKIEDFPIGGIPLHEHHARICNQCAEPLRIQPHAWLDARDLAMFLKSGSRTLISETGSAIAWFGETPDAELFSVVEFSFIIAYPWDFLRANESYVASLAESKVEGEVHPLAVIEGTVHIGTGTRILPGVFIEGNAVIGKNCKIGPNCYIRGNTSIGDHCHIGQSVEIKNCLILSNTNVGHLSYVGDSVLGEKVNFGAGTTTSNLRHDGKNHRTAMAGKLIDTGRRKFGTIVGDRVHTGIHTSIYPGRKIWPGATTRPAEVVQQDLGD